MGRLKDHLGNVRLVFSDWKTFYWRITIDPLWEKYYGWSPYVYAGNNPLTFLDPSGLTLFQLGFKDGEGDYAIDDGSNAVFTVKGTDINKHFEFIGYDETMQGENTINFTSAIQEAQKLNMNNSALKKNEKTGDTYCNYGTRNILRTIASTPGNESIMNGMSGNAKSMIGALKNKYVSTTLKAATAAAANGGLVIEGINVSKAAHDHIATFTVGSNLQGGNTIIANIGSKNVFRGVHTKADYPKAPSIQIYFFIIPLE